jgi:AraC-like DNA-binding protein/mannose-6-phosphate isomerase-like protein (cupin superfamily)
MTQKAFPTPIYYRTRHAELIYLAKHARAYPPHSHVSVYMAGFVLDGTMELRYDDESRLLCAGECFAMPPYVVHAIVPRDWVEMVTLCIPVDIVLGEATISLPDAIRGLSPLLAADGLADAGGRILRQAGRLFSGDAQRLPCCAYVARLRHLLERQSDETSTMRQWAKVAGVSQDQLIRRFKREVGLTPRRFLLQNRVRKAQRLIERGMSIADVAQAAGFYDQSHFDKRFRRVLTIECFSCMLFSPVIIRGKACWDVQNVVAMRSSRMANI